MATNKVQTTTVHSDMHSVTDMLTGPPDQVDEAITAYFRKFPTEKYSTDILDIDEKDGTLTVKIQRVR